MQAEELAPGFTVLDMSDWQIIPAENLIAAFQVNCIHCVCPSPLEFAVEFARTSTFVKDCIMRCVYIGKCHAHAAMSTKLALGSLCTCMHGEELIRQDALTAVW